MGPHFRRFPLRIVGIELFYRLDTSHKLSVLKLKIFTKNVNTGYVSVVKIVDLHDLGSFPSETHQRHQEWHLAKTVPMLHKFSTLQVSVHV